MENVRNVIVDDLTGKLFKELVPIKGKCDSVAGELVRTFNQILYKCENDGDCPESTTSYSFDPSEESDLKSILQKCVFLIKNVKKSNYRECWTGFENAFKTRMDWKEFSEFLRNKIAPLVFDSIEESRNIPCEEGWDDIKLENNRGTLHLIDERIGRGYEDYVFEKYEY